jgi:hypothetical protein
VIIVLGFGSSIVRVNDEARAAAMRRTLRGNRTPEPLLAINAPATTQGMIENRFVCPRSRRTFDVMGNDD